MVNLVKGLIALIMIFGLGMGVWGFMGENMQPALDRGWLHLAALYAAALLLGPAVAVVGGRWGESYLRKDFQAMVDQPVPGGGIAVLVLKYPAAYFLLLSIVCGGTFLCMVFGGGVHLERHHAVSAGETTCAIEGSRILRDSLKNQLDLQCPIGRKVAMTKLILKDAPGKLPAEITLPVLKGVLGTLFVDGRNVRL
jgi:hypothetical protein